MKKTYMNPALEVVELHISNSLLAGSDVAIGEGTVSDFNSLQGRDNDMDDDF